MGKYSKGVTLAIAPWKTVRIDVTDKDSFEECDKELLEQLDQMPDIKKLNEVDIKKVFPNGKSKR